MMTPNMLNRATHNFRRGYNDCHMARESILETLTPGTFAHTDYSDGWKAAEAELRNQLRREKRTA